VKIKANHVNIDWTNKPELHYAWNRIDHLELLERLFVTREKFKSNPGSVVLKGHQHQRYQQQQQQQQQQQG